MILNGHLNTLNVLHHSYAESDFHSPSPHPALGLDYGASRIGVSATDDMGLLAHPVETIQNSSDDNVISRIIELIKLRKIRTIVIGIPYRMDGTEGDSANKVRSFAQKLNTALPQVPICYVDESFTTMDASEKLRQTGRKAHRQKSIIDQVAAMEILNRWMEESS